jgi:hypothetical protein
MPIVFNYDNLIAGDYPVVTEAITVAQNQTIKRGDVLIISGGQASRAGAVLIATDDVVIASEDVTTGAGVTQASVGYRTGLFNEFAMRFGGASTAAQNKPFLLDKNIYIKQNIK